MTFGGDLNDRFKDFILTDDGGCLVVGVTYPVSGDADPVIFKLNMNYEIEWSREYGQDSIDIYRSVVYKDGYYYLAGHTNSYEEQKDVLVSKIDESGNEIWTKTYGGNGCAGAYCGDDGQKIIVHNDNLIICGDFASEGSGLISAYYFTINDNGELLNEQFLDSNGSEMFFDGKVSDSENLVFTGTSKVNGGWEPWLYVLNQDLEILFSNAFGDASTTADGGHRVALYADDTYMLTRFSWLYVVLNKVDIDGNLVWSKKYEGNDPGDIVIYGDAIYFLTKMNYENTLSVIKTDLNGDVIWNKHFSSLSIDASLKADNDNLFIMGNVGTVENNDDIYMFTIDFDGNTTNCYENELWSTFYYENNDNIFQNELDYLPSDNNFATMQDVENTETNTGFSLNNLCVEPILGCTDETACNYCEECVSNETLCVYPSECGDCEAEFTQEINLSIGWSLFSTYICPLNPNIETMMTDLLIDDNLMIMKDELGNVYWPEYNINDIGQLVNGKAYLIKLQNETILTISGGILSYDYPINLHEGWSLLGYLHPSANLLINMTPPLDENLIIIKDGNANVYWPEYNINNIGSMQPGEGYQIKLDEEINFSYPAE
tara:strand:- start:81 stop:1889 length:1809 start_codon:yes stop_codon:yes gene_type:complete